MTTQFPSAIGLIAERYGSLSGAHRRLADFILSDPHGAALMTLEGLSEASGVSPATANRLGRSLGLSGYPEFKRLLRADLQEALKEPQAAPDAIRIGGLSPAAPWTRSLEVDARRILGIGASGGDAGFARACDLFARAARLFVAGFGSSGFLAEYAAFNFATLRDGCIALSDAGGMESVMRKALSAGPQDAALLLAFARYSRPALAVAQCLHEAGVPVVAVTDGFDAPVAPLAAETILVARKAGYVLTGGGAGAAAAIEALLHGTASAIGIDAVEARAARLAGRLGEEVVPPGP